MAVDEIYATAMRENRQLRQILCDVLKALGNGSGAMPEASIEFLSDIPEEVRLVVADLRAAGVALPAAPRFQNTSCSQCGGKFGPGDQGFSHCDDHRKVQTQ